MSYGIGGSAKVGERDVPQVSEQSVQEASLDFNLHQAMSRGGCSPLGDTEMKVNELQHGRVALDPN